MRYLQVTSRQANGRMAGTACTVSWANELMQSCVRSVAPLSVDQRGEARDAVDPRPPLEVRPLARLTRARAA